MKAETKGIPSLYHMQKPDGNWRSESYTELCTNTTQVTKMSKPAGTDTHSPDLAFDAAIASSFAFASRALSFARVVAFSHIMNIPSIVCRRMHRMLKTSLRPSP